MNEFDNRRHPMTPSVIEPEPLDPSKTLALDTSRCSGRMDLLPDGHWCRQRDSCQRYLALVDWDKKAGLPDYKGISVTMAVPNCQNKIEVEND